MQLFSAWSEGAAASFTSRTLAEHAAGRGGNWSDICRKSTLLLQEKKEELERQESLQQQQQQQEEEEAVPADGGAAAAQGAAAVRGLGSAVLQRFG